MVTGSHPRDVDHDNTAFTTAATTTVSAVTGSAESSFTKQVNSFLCSSGGVRVQRLDYYRSLQPFHKDKLRPASPQAK